MVRDSFPGALNLYRLRVVALVWLLVAAPLRYPGAELLSLPFRFWIVDLTLGLLLEGLGTILLFPFARAHRGGPQARWANAAIVLSALSFVLHLLRSLESFGGPPLVPPGAAGGGAIYAGAFAVTVASTWVFWALLEKTGAQWVRRAYAPAFYGCLAVSAGLTLASFTLPIELDDALFRTGAAAAWVHALRSIAAAGHELLPMLVLRRLPRTEAEEVQANLVARDLAIGCASLVAGLLVTMLSFAVARGGGRVVVATGAIGIGTARLLRALIRTARS